MKTWLTVFEYELRQQFRRKSFLFVTFGLPLLAVAAFLGYQAYQNSQDSTDKPASPVTEVNQGGVQVGYVDLTPDGLFPGPDRYEEVRCTPTNLEIALLGEETAPLDHTRADVIKRISSPYCLKGQVIEYASFDEGKTALEDDKIDVLYVIEPDYVEKGNVSQYLIGFDIEAASNSDQVIEDFMLRSQLNTLPTQDYESLYLRLRDVAVVTDHTVTDTGATQSNNEDQNFLLIYGFGLLMIMAVFWGGGYLMQSVVQEKETRIVEIVLSSVPPTPLLTGKILAMGLLTLLQLTTLIGAFIFIVSQAGDIWSALNGIEIDPARVTVMAIFALLGFLLFGSLMAAIGALCTTMRESQNYVVLVTLPAMVPFFFLTMFAEEPNGSLATIFSLIPVTAPLSMIMRTAVTDVPVGELALSLGLLVAAVAGAIWLAGRLFRVNTLLMGNMPRFRDIPKLLRG